MRSIVADHWNDEDFVVLKVDMRNAFNMISRQAVLDECSKHFPELLPWVAWCYKAHPQLWHALGRFVSAAGVQQGDPIGPLLFAVALNRLIVTINAIEGIKHNLWYLDDGLICGTRQAIMDCLQAILSAQFWTGLEVNMKKCELFSNSDLSYFPADIKKSNSSNMEILEAPG
jgi:hypothetical protein